MPKRKVISFPASTRRPRRRHLAGANVYVPPLSLRLELRYLHYCLYMSPSTTLRTLTKTTTSPILKLTTTTFSLRSPRRTLTTTRPFRMASSDDSCIFCKIIKGDIPSFKLFDSDKVFAFLDIQPLSRGHAVCLSRPILLLPLRVTPCVSCTFLHLSCSPTACPYADD